MKVSISQFCADLLVNFVPQKSKGNTVVTARAAATTFTNGGFNSDNGVQKISYFIDPALANPNNVNTDWSHAIFAAIVDYKNIVNSCVDFIAAPNTAQADLSFVLNGSRSDVTGARGYPTEGKISKCIRLLGSNLPSINKERIALHELGHALGQR